jgi:hypothetical protein
MIKLGREGPAPCGLGAEDGDRRAASEETALLALSSILDLFLMVHLPVKITGRSLLK